MDVSKGKIEDFGEKIGGARKDMYISRGGLNISDLDELDEREYEDHVKKDNIWAKPTVKFNNEKITKGVEPAVLLYVKKLRDALPSKPEKNTYTYAKIYIELIKIYRDVSEELKVTSDLYTVRQRLIEEAEKRGFEYINDRTYRKAKEVAVLRGINIRELEIEAEIQDFPNQFKGALKGLTVRNYNSVMSSRKGYVIVKGNSSVSGYTYPYSTEEEAIKVLKEEVVPKLLGKSVTKKKETKTNKFVRPQLAHIVRDGEDYRLGIDISGEDMLKAFGFRGGEFGNWNTQADRQACLNHSYDAFCDLASVLRVPFDFIGLGGYKNKKLAIAFGARGQGSALAHYESANVVINLTKMKGAGALAHEWGHALDDYIGIKCGYNSFFTKNGLGFMKKTDNYIEIQESFRNLMGVIKYREATDEEILEQKEGNLKIYKENVTIRLKGFENKSIRTKEGYKNISDESKAKLIAVKEKLISDMTIESLEELSKVHKEETKVLPSKDLRDALAIYVRQYGYIVDSIEDFKNGNISERPKRATEFYKGAKELDKYRDDNYFESDVELFARAFEAYVDDKLSSRGIRSDYLVHSTRCSYYPGMSPYPNGEERLLINKTFDDFLHLVVSTFSEVTEYYTSEDVCTTEDLGVNKDISNLKEDDTIVDNDFELENNESNIEEDSINKDNTNIVDKDKIENLKPTKIANTYGFDTLIDECYKQGVLISGVRLQKEDGGYKGYKIVFRGSKINHLILGISKVDGISNYILNVDLGNRGKLMKWGNLLDEYEISKYIIDINNKL